MGDCGELVKQGSIQFYISRRVVFAQPFVIISKPKPESKKEFAG